MENEEVEKDDNISNEEENENKEVNSDNNKEEDNQPEKKTQINSNSNNSEVKLNKDINKAMNEVLSSMMKDSSKNNSELYNLLLNNNQFEEDIKKENSLKHVDISSKLQNYDDIKKEKIKNMEQKKEEEFKKNHTFIPETNTNKEEKKRNLTQFLEDQQSYQKIIKDKIENLKETEKKKEEQFNYKPKILNNSEKLANKKNKGEKVFNRLYNKPEPKKKEEKKEKKKNINSNINEEYFNEMYNEAKKREKKLKDIEENEKLITKKNQEYKTTSNSNKFLFNKFQNKYKKEIEEIKLENNQINIDKLNIILKNLKFLIDSENKKDLEKQNNLVNDLFNNLKIEKENDFILNDDLFVFCLCILRLYEYYILNNYKIPETKTENTNNKNSNINNETNNNNNKNITDETIEKLDLINKDLISKIEKNNNKYCSISKDNNILITLAQSKLISKDFKLFYQNYIKKPVLIETNNLNDIKKTKSNNQQIKNLNINRSSTSHNKTKTQNNQPQIQTNENKKRGSLRLDKLYLDNTKRQKQLEQNIEKQRKQKEEEEMKQCTFKPKINTNHKKDNDDIQFPNVEERAELLYKKGTEILLNKKDKTSDEIEVERNKKDFTFKPNIHEVNYDVFKKNKRLVNEDADVKKLMERLENGRKERNIKMISQERGEFLLNKKIEEMNNEYKKNNKKNNNDNLNSNETDRIKNNEHPLLEIDVNLKHGIKKKVYVFDGDKAEDLAKNFAKENKLDINMTNKLTILIQNEMDKLLARIAEETQSTLKSSNSKEEDNNNKNNEVENSNE